MNSKRTWVRILAYSGVAGLLGKGTQFLGLTFLALILLPDDFGRFAIAQVVSTGFVSIVSSSFAIAANRRFARTAPDQIRLIAAGSAVAFRKQLTIVAIAAVILIPVLYGVLSGEGVPLWTLPWALLSTSAVVVDVASGSLAGSGAVRTAGLLDATRMLAVGFVTLGMGAALGYIGAIFGLLLFDGLLALTIMGTAIFSRRLLSREVVGTLESEEHRTIGAGVLSNGVTALANWASTWAIQTLFGLTAVGAYSVASRFASLVLIVPGLISRNSLGHLARQKAAGSNRSQLNALLAYLGIVILVVTCASLIVLPIVEFGFHQLTVRYDQLWSILGIILTAMAIRALATALGIICVSWGRLGVWVSSDVFAAAGMLLWIAVAVGSAFPLPLLLIGSVISAAIALLIRGAIVIRGAILLMRGAPNG